MLETKLLVNSVFSDAKEGAQFMSCHLKNFFMYCHEHVIIYVNPIQVLPRGRYNTVYSRREGFKSFHICENQTRNV